MEKKMICFQEDTARLQDELTGALIGLVRATQGNEYLVTKETTNLVIEALYATTTNVNFNDETLKELIKKVHEEKHRLVPDCSVCASPCGRTADYDMQRLWSEQEDVRLLKERILFGIREMAAYAYHAEVSGYSDDHVNEFFCRALFSVGMDYDMEDLLPIVREAEEVNLKCMELLDKARK